MVSPARRLGPRKKSWEAKTKTRSEGNANVKAKAKQRQSKGQRKDKGGAKATSRVTPRSCVGKRPVKPWRTVGALVRIKSRKKS